MILCTMNKNIASCSRSTDECNMCHVDSISRRYRLLASARCYLCSLIVVILIFLGPHFGSTQSTFRPNNLAQTERYPNPPKGPLLAQTTTGEIYTDNEKNYLSQAQTQQQISKSFKFTLIAGKFWKFNIKANSFTSHKEKELRLHKNMSINNYIIDDDGWFQYNHQQQQLFAWPSLDTKPSTYYFVLLPSGLDFEADGENVVKNTDVVANIVVELIRPHYQGTHRTDIDQLIDHKFSLNHLHRHTDFPLLLNQIVSVFDILSKSNGSVHQNSPLTTTPSSVAILQARQRHLRLANKLSEYLLISFSFSNDGDSFSITWTIQPSLVNNTIIPISECRLTTINDVVTKLSSPSSGFLDGVDKFILYYPLEATIVNSQTIVPMGRGKNYALTLILSGPCKRANIIEELGIVSSSAFNIESNLDLEDKENNVYERHTAPAPSSQVATSAQSVQPQGPPPEPDTLDSNSTSHFITNTRSLTTSTESTVVTTKPDLLIPLESVSPTTETVPITIANTAQVHIGNTSTTTEQISLVRAATGQGAHAGTTTTSTTASPTITTTTTSAPDAQVFKFETPPFNSVQTTKTQPQAKSFANFLDSSDLKSSNFTMATTTLPTLTIDEIHKIVNMTTIGAVSDVPPTSSTNPQETSLNEDMIGLLSGAMDYLVSIAVPVSIIVGIILLVSIVIAICNLCMKKRKSKQFDVDNRFKFRYGSERRVFLKSNSKPVILEADQKSLSIGGLTPKHKAHKDDKDSDREKKTYLKMKPIKSQPAPTTNDSSNRFFLTPFVFSPGGDTGANCTVGDRGGGDFSGGCDSGGGFSGGLQ